uniref:HAT C-terminal dimerisation domain-containing protein n=1 Tax=Acrobeloides nanus TaxID=290746 RepID=A0A914DNS0_9BILA
MSQIQVEPETKASVLVVDYLTRKNLPMTKDPYCFWKENGNSLAPLAILGRKYLSAPLGSIESERLFFIASLIITSIRMPMSEDTLEKLLFFASKSLKF